MQDSDAVTTVNFLVMIRTYIPTQINIDRQSPGTNLRRWHTVGIDCKSGLEEMQILVDV